MNQAFLLSSILFLGLMGSSLKIRDWWSFRREVPGQVAFGYVLALVSTQAMVGLDAACNGLAWNAPGVHEAPYLLSTAFIAALLVPFIEETFFRGFLQSELIRILGMPVGWILAAVIFTLAHFLKVSAGLDGQSIHWWSGATAVGAAFRPIVEGDFLTGRGLNLFLIGLILGGLFLRNGMLWVNYGLHSGWILALMLMTGWTRQTETPHPKWTEGDLLSSPLTSAVLLVLGCWLWRFYRSPLNKPESGESAG